MITYMCCSPRSRERDLRRLVDCNLRRADRYQPLLGVPGCAAGVGDPDDHARDLEAALRDLSDDQVRVVAAGSGDEDARLLDPRFQQGIDLERGADREAPAGVLPGCRLVSVEPLMRQRIG